MIMIGLCEIKIFINNSIYKSLINFRQINLMLKLNIVFPSFFRSLHKTYISSNIIYYNALVMQLLVLDMFIKVHVIIQDKKMIESSFIRNFFYDGFGIDLQPVSNGLI